MLLGVVLTRMRIGYESDTNRIQAEEFGHTAYSTTAYVVPGPNAVRVLKGKNASNKLGRPKMLENKS